MVSDHSVDFFDLDERIGIDSRAARGVIDSRPIENLAELGAISHIGVAACNQTAFGSV